MFIRTTLPPGQPPPITIRRLTAGGIPWRVRAEVWEEEEGCTGRLTFEAERVRARTLRLGPATLRGPTPVDVLSAAHELPEKRLRALLHSLG